MNSRFASSLALLAILAASAGADPLPGRDVLKFSQQPMINTTFLDWNGTIGVYGGHDELSTAYGFAAPNQVPAVYQGRFMADDFADKLTSPVVHVKWWGSYLNDFIDSSMPVNQFLISFESDVPQSATNPFSRPGQPLLNQTVTRVPVGGALTPGSGTFTEKVIRGPDPVVKESLYEYNAELNLGKEFFEQKDTVYWLKIVAMVDVPAGVPTFPVNQPPATVTQWGWHNRDYTIQNTLASNNIPGPPFPPGEQPDGPPGPTPIWHFQDDAVTGDVRITPNATGYLMPDIFQPFQNMSPTHYLDFADGPGPGPIPGALSIGQFSKDLAFELYTVPEPATCGLACLAFAALGLRRRG